MGFLSEIAEFVRDFSEVAKIVPPEKLAVITLGLLGGGGYVGYRFGKSMRPALPIESAPQPKSQPGIYDPLIDALSNDNQDLWQLYRAQVPTELLDRIHASGMKVVTFTNLKGGVGKTTLTANIAAYFAKRGDAVLLIDFDYQGSLSATVLLDAGRGASIESMSDKILTGQLTTAQILSPTLAPRSDLSKLSLVPAGDEVNRQENRMLVRWLLQLDAADPRFALVRLLSSPEVAKTFKYVFIDTPPRMGLGTINGLCACTHFVVPAILDELSTGNISSLLGQVDSWFRKELNPRIKCAGLVAMMTDTTIVRNELAVQNLALSRALDKWGPGADFLPQNVPETARFQQDAGKKIAYLDNRAINLATRTVIEALGGQLAERLKS